MIDFLLYGAALFCFLVEAYQVTRIEVVLSAGAFGIVLSVLPFVVGVLLVVAARKASAAVKGNIVALMLSVGLPLYGIEGWQAWREFHPPTNANIMIDFARAAGRPADARTPKQAIADYRRQGVDVGYSMPNTTPFSADGIPAAIVAPGLANNAELSCNESGSYLIHQTDEYGFLNPRGIWGRRPVSVLAVGDSFTHANCVDVKDTPVGVIRERFPNSLSLGMYGAGPTFYHVMLLEYGPVLKPGVVLFNWFEGNDVSDLAREVSDPIMASYIGRTQRLGIYERQNEIDAWKRGRAGYADAEMGEVLRQTALLVRTRQLLGLGITGNRRATLVDMIRARREGRDLQASVPLNKEMLAKLLAGSKAVVDQWGGRLVFVYNPAWERFCPQEKWGKYCPDSPGKYGFNHDVVIETARSLGIEVVDLAERFKGRPDVADYYWFPGSHFSVKGYRAAAEEELRAISR